LGITDSLLNICKAEPVDPELKKEAFAALAEITKNEKVAEKFAEDPILA